MQQSVKKFYCNPVLFSCTFPVFAHRCAGFNVETVVHKGTKFALWDVGGQDKIRPLWKHYVEDTDVAVWVVDSTDRNRLEEAKTELMKIVGCRELTGVPLLTCRVPFPESLFEAIDLARLPSVYVSLA
eukprot:m.229779 g.229779  ORF g.229779 m.229779 type:complete len:128 (+) comp22403_c4_seq3:1374-1757(+)